MPGTVNLTKYSCLGSSQAYYYYSTNTETPNRSVCKQLMSKECSVTDGISLAYFLTPRLRAILEQGVKRL